MKTSKILLFVALVGIAMSGGVHRVAQSAWNCPQQGRATTLSLFFALDSALPAAGYMYVTLPSAHVPTIATPSVIHAWALTTSLTPPTTATNLATCTWSAPLLKCTFASALTAGTSYGLAIPGSGAVAGSFAPVAIETRMNNLATAGPVMDINRVFDSVNVDATAPTFTLAQAKITATGATAKEFPGETAEVEWTFTMSSWAATKVIKAPFNIVMTLGAPPDRAQVATASAWVKYPMTYDPWTWVTTCTNTQFGVDDADTSDNVGPVTLKDASPKCTAKGHVLTIPMAQDLTSTDYSTFKMKFKISVKMPTNLIGTGTTVDAYFADPASNNVHATAAQITGFLSVTKPSGQADSDASAIVSFGKNPNDAAEILLGVGIYSSHFCIATADYVANYVSNCQLSTAVDAAVASTGTPVAMLHVNAIELTWALPYGIPADRTEAMVICKTEQKSGGNNAATHYTNDPIRVHQSSMIAKGFGAGNCFYLGVAVASPGEHRFLCRNVGALAKSASLQLAFQYTISSIGKTLSLGAASDATKNTVQLIALTLACELKIYTYTSATSSAVLWYQSKFTGNIDGNTQSNANGKWQSFIGHKNFPSLGQGSASTDFYSGQTVAITTWIVLGFNDAVVDTASHRQFPFDTSTTTLDLIFTGYGAAGIQSAATCTVTIPSVSRFVKANQNLNSFETEAQFALDTLYTTLAMTASTPAQQMKFTFLKEKWGGDCCGEGTCAAEANGYKACDKTAAQVTSTTVKLGLFAKNVDNLLSHSLQTKDSNEFQSLVQVVFNGALTLPSAHFTSVRGRGPLGSANQKLCDVFWVMTTSGSTPTALQMYLHFYIQVASGSVKTDAQMIVQYGFPVNSWSAKDASNTFTKNDGSQALATGMKLYIAAGQAPLAEYYGFYALKMIPFFKATGGNEIVTVVNSDRAVQCWSWGSYGGEGWAYKHDRGELSYFATAKYQSLVQYAQMNMVICKLGTTQGTATTGDIVIIPSTQSDPGVGGANNPLPEQGQVTMLPSSVSGITDAQTSTTNFFAILAGTDEYLGTMTFISQATTAFNTIHPSADATAGAAAGTDPAVFLPIGITQAQRNTNSGSGGEGTWDMLQKTSGEWVIGTTKINALLNFKNAADSDWTDAQGVAAICTHQGGATIPSTLTMSAGNTGTGSACTGVFQYVVGANDHLVTTGYNTRASRQCRWCSTGNLAGGLTFAYIADFVPPTTSTRLLSGVSIFAASSAGVMVVTMDTNPTSTKQASVVIAASGCGKTGQTTLKSTTGQTVEFTIKSPVPLAAGQFVRWQDVTSGGAKNFQLAANLPANSVKCTCGAVSWTTTLARGTADVHLQLTMPTLAEAGITDTNGTPTQVICAAGDLSCKARAWSSGAGVVTEATLTCFACDSGDAACTKEESAASPGKGVAQYVSSVTFTMKQDGTAATDVLKVKDVAYWPNTMTAVGRFVYKPQFTGSLYGSHSTIAYTFGAQTFGTGAICQVFTSSGTLPTMTPSDLVSNCVISGSTVTLTMAKDGAANFHVSIVGMDAWAASATNKVTGSVTSFTIVDQSTDSTAANQYAMHVEGTTAASSNKVATVLTVVVARSLVNVMDIGMVSFTLTSDKTAFGADSMAIISFPSYYNPDIGSMLRCTLYDVKGKKDAETLYCRVQWGYTLAIWGPSTTQAAAAAFELRVYGVAMNLHAAAGNFGVGLTNTTYWNAEHKLTDFALKADTATGVWGGKLAIDVTSLSLSSSALRSTTDITMAFTLPATTDTVTASSDFVALSLPYQFGGVSAWEDGTATPSAALKLVVTTAGKTTKTAVKGAVSQVSGCALVFALDATATKLAEGSSYEFTVSGVPTAENAALGAQMNLGSMALSVGKVATGGFGYSSAQLFNAMAAQVPATGLNLLEFSSAAVAINRGTYTKQAVCIQPASGNFRADVSVAVSGSTFKTNPASIAAKMGSAQACADMGTAATTAVRQHYVRWAVNNGSTVYTALPTMTATVGSAKGSVVVPSAVTCSLGGSSVPIVVSTDALPFSDIKVSLKTSIATDEAKTDNSVGITPNAGEIATINLANPTGVLGFKCAATVTGKELVYVLAGTDAAVFSLGATTMTVTAVKAGTKPAAPAMKLAMVADKSKPASTVVEGECPGMGNSWINLMPIALAGKALASAADVSAAHGKFVASDNSWQESQWCNVAVTAAAQKTTCTFASASKAQYQANLYCETIEGWFFASASAVNVTAKDNGGKQVSLALTYKKAINDITNNAVVLNIACKLAESMAVPYNRVTDAYGGYCNSPSPSLPASAPAPAAAANATANKTRLLANATANATAKVQTEWVINMFVQPDPFAEKADNDATAKAASGTAAQAAIDGVTKATYGAMTAVAKATTEAAVKWVKAPAATGGAKQITIAGSTDVGAYVYCAVSKTASRRMLNATNASNATAAPAAKAKEVVNLQSAATAAKYNIQRQETKAGALAFSLAFSGLGEGSTYSWLCEATSLNPIAPAFRTAMSKGTAATNAAAPTSTGDSALWSSLFAAILMVAAVFFY